jgi:hypothetical protein
MPLTDEELKRRLKEQNWTAHNIRLSPAVTTRPGEPDFFETDLRLKAIIRALSFVYRNRLEGLRAADLGSLEGGFALALAERGMEVTAIEARRKNLDKCLLLKEHFGLANLRFLHDDVKNLTAQKFDMFDVVLALGILYHLDQPLHWLRRAAEVVRGMLVIDSHYAPADDALLSRIDQRLALGPLKNMRDGEEVYEGRWFFEYDDKANREDQLWASYSNGSSFWLTKESLLKALLRSGFDLVLEQHDYSVDSYKHLSVTFPRVMLLAIKTSGFTRS